MITLNIQDFLLSLPPMGRILCIDFGTKKLGIATSNDERTMALPLAVIKPSTQNIESLLKQHISCGIVIGLPINMDGSAGVQVDQVQKFAEYIERSFNLPIFLQDERLTSRAASGILKGFGIKRSERDKIDDQLAASLILETVIDLMRKVRE